MATPPPSGHDAGIFPDSTSETGEPGSILFSEQVRAEIDGDNRRVLGRAATAAAGRPDDDQNQNGTSNMSNMFMYVDDEDDVTPVHTGIIVDDGPTPTKDEPMADAETLPNDGAPADNVDMHFWLESQDDGDTEMDGDASTVVVAKSEATDGVGAASDNFEKEREEGDEEDEDDEDDYSEPMSYHSGDSDEYEMEHRPWLDRTAVKRDIQDLYAIKGLYHNHLRKYRYRVVDRLGEGTFSSVYLAYDSLNNMYDNSYWMDKEQNESTPDNLFAESKKVKVALKKILVTSSPARVENELSILENLRGCRNVSPLVTAFRDEDQVVIVLPYHKSDDFRYFYRLMNPPKIQQYMTCLLRSLKDIHARGIIHRDVKPANFLFDYEAGTGVLVDFGLAERYQPPRRPACQHEPATREHLHGVRTKTTDTVAVEQAVYDARKRAKSGDVGFRQQDSRPAIKTNRAGTRGFRAPEVLLKCPDQTVAIDIWSAGVILLSLLAHKFPVFNSTDDVEALMEIAAVFGKGAMERCAMLHNRTIICNVPAVESPPDSLAALILRLNPHLYTPHQLHPTPEDAMQHITAVDQALDLVNRMLRVDSTSRLTAAAALRHPFLASDAGDDDGPDELLEVTEGKCGYLHTLTAEGQHQASFGGMNEDMRFGQGLPLTRDSMCPEHEHWQQRSGVNPIGAALGARLDEEYYELTGFHVYQDYENWDDPPPADADATPVR